MANLVQSPFVPILDLAGKALNAGKVYIGVENQNPRTNPQAAYWDKALTVPATQPLNVVGGYIYRSGSPASVYVASRYSIAADTVQDVQVYYEPSVGPPNALLPDLSNVDASPAEGAAFLDAIEANAANIIVSPIVTLAPQRTVETHIRDWIGIKDLAAVVGDGVVDDAPQIQFAYNRAATLGVNVLFPAGTFRANSKIVIPAGVSTQGQGLATVLLKGVAATSYFEATDIPASDAIGFASLSFIVDPGTPHTQVNQFILLTRCHGVTGDQLWFDSFNGSNSTTLFGHMLNYYGDDQILTRIRSRGSFGNCIGPNGDGLGAGGKRHIYTDIMLIDFVDTGLGLWTGAEDFVMSDFYLKALAVADGEPAYDRACIDCAGITRAKLINGTIEGGTFGIRCVTNLGFTSQYVTGQNITFRNQEQATEAGQAIKVANSGAQEMSIRALACDFFIDGENGIAAQSTDPAGSLRIGADRCRFIGDGVAIQVRADGGGGSGLMYEPGANDMSQFPSGGGNLPYANMGLGAATQVVTDPAREMIYSQGHGWATVTFNNASTSNTVFTGYMGVGFYRVSIRFGAMTDVAGGVTPNIFGNTSFTWTAALAGTTVDYYVTVTTAALTSIAYTSTASSNNYTFRDINVQRVM